MLVNCSVGSNIFPDYCHSSSCVSDEQRFCPQAPRVEDASAYEVELVDVGHDGEKPRWCALSLDEDSIKLIV